MKEKIVIPATIVNEVESRVKAFNEAKLAKKKAKYVPVIKGKFIYLMRTLTDGSLEHVCRLTYTGAIEDMDFAIYKYSTEKYDPNEWFFDPGVISR